MDRFGYRTLRAARTTVIAAAVVAATGVAALAQTSSDQQDSLRAAALLFRHSVISPKYTPPKVDTKQLTAVGMRDMYQRGQELRRKYVDELGLISGTYQLDEVYVRASNADRSLQSAQMLVLGLFPLTCARATQTARSSPPRCWSWGCSRWAPAPIPPFTIRT
jgi:hypothetical protein